jgi:hypothetical protein
MAVEFAASPVQAQAIELMATLSNFLGDLWAIPQVRRVGINSTETPIQLWVLLDHEDLAVSKSILRRHWLLFEQSTRPSIDIHVVPLDRVKAEHVPPSRTLFER